MYTDSYTHTHRVHALPLTPQGTSPKLYLQLFYLACNFFLFFFQYSFQFLHLFFFLFQTTEFFWKEKKKRVKIQINTKKRQTLAGTKFSAAENNKASYATYNKLPHGEAAIRVWL